jgi:hypothetical protein
MRCAQCNQPIHDISQPCPACQFQGDPALLEQLAHVEWLLTQLPVWPAITSDERQFVANVRKRTIAQTRDLRIRLGLLFGEDAAKAAWPRLAVCEELEPLLDEWRRGGLLRESVAQTIGAELTGESATLRRKLAGYSREPYPIGDGARLGFVNAQLQLLDAWQQRALFVDRPSFAKARAPLAAEQERIELLLGVRAQPQPASSVVQSAVPDLVDLPIPAPAPVAARATAPPRSKPPAPPFRDRFWRTLLSERTLQALLFLGIFLLFAAAVSFVIIGWETFPAILRVVIPSSFTVLFFALGWYVRTRTQLYRSGIALTAIASLLIPIDLYTVYANFDVPPDAAPTFWLLTSLLCLGAYIATTAMVRSRFFGYLVGTAAGSVMLSLVEIAHQGVGLSLDWRPAALAVLAGGFVGAATTIDRTRRTEDGGRKTEAAPGGVVRSTGVTISGVTSDAPDDATTKVVTTSEENKGAGGIGTAMIRLRTRAEVESDRMFAFAEPLRNLALLGAAILMLLTFGVRYIERHDVDTLHSSLALTWFVGALIFGWGALYYRSRGLGIIAAVTLPVATYLGQGSLFAQFHVRQAWHAFGWALLVPLYFYVSHRLRTYTSDPVLRAHGRTAGGWGVVLLVVAAFWSLLDITSGAAAAASHAVLTLGIILAARCWLRPRYLYAASLFALSASTFGMSQGGVPLAQMGIGWATLAIAHVLVALRLGRTPSQPFARPCVVAGYVIAALAVVPSLAPYNADLFIYALANWIGLAAWGARLAHIGQAGFASTADRSRFGALRQSVFQWLAAVPLPVWVWAVMAHRGPVDATLPLALAGLAWFMIALSIRLAALRRAYRGPWYVVGLLVSIVAIEAAYVIVPDMRIFALTLLSAGLLYFVDAVLNRQSAELLAAGLVTAWGFGLLLERAPIDYDAVTLALALLAGAYLGGGLAVVRRRLLGLTQPFLSPLFVAAHLVAAGALLRVYVHPLYTLLYRVLWGDDLLLWGAACQLLLGLVYAAYAWGTFKRHWAYAGVWLLTAGGGFIALLYSTGSGSLAAKTALGALFFIVAERILHDLRHPGNDLEVRLPRWLTPWRRAVVRSLWRLFALPLLVTGWLVSLATIANALLRNLLLLNGRAPQTWAAIALLLIAGLYALSARLFKQARFLWFAAVLLFAPWTILTYLGFYILTPPSVPGFAISWVALAWLLLLAGLGLGWRLRRPLGDLALGDLNTKMPLRLGSPIPVSAYTRPMKVVAHVIVPGALLWGMFDVDTSRVTVLMAIGFYALSTVLDFAEALANPAALSTRRHRLRATRFFYPWLGLIPVWCLYLLAWLLPTARQEMYGLLLVIFGTLGLLTGQWLERVAPRPAFASLRPTSLPKGEGDARPSPQRVARAYGVPAYLTGCIAAIFGTLLVAHIPALLALVLLYDAALAIASARVFRQPLWLYLATALTPLALGFALDESAVPFNRYGWWLLALAAIYSALAWALRRIKLDAYSVPLFVAGFALVALGLPPSSRDQDGALYGYAGAALLYAVNAFGLRQPLMLTPAALCILVPYVVLLRRSPLPPEQYGLALLPGAVAALACGVLLDRRCGAIKDFPWGRMQDWKRAFGERWLNWWALPVYTLGFGLAVFSPLLAGFRDDYRALTLLLLVPVLGWAINQFRLRIWLAATALAAHLAWWSWLRALGWQDAPLSELAIRVLPLTILTALLGLWVQWRRKEDPPLTLDPDYLWRGWSHVLYVFVFVDIYAAQGVSLTGTWASALVTLSHALLLGVLASVWFSWWLPYVVTLLGITAYQQWLSTLGGGAIEGWPVALSYLALAYGVTGFVLRFAHMRYDQVATGTLRTSNVRALGVIWEAPLVRTALGFSLAILLLTGWLGIDLIGWTIRALFGAPVREIVRLPVAQMIVGVCAVLGLLYVTAAFGWRRLRLGYAAIALLLTAWGIHAFYVHQWDDTQRVQLYALPAGAYLLTIAYLEWRRGNRTLARWLDYAAVLLMMGSLFWQTMLFGWTFALLLGAEGFAAFWWGSARRLRRFLYVGMLGVVLATLAQLLNALQSVNQWIVFGLIGLLVVLTAVAIERQLEAIKAWRETLETWE